MVDALDTLWLMGMKDEFEEAKEWVDKSLSFDKFGLVSVFETTIRELGGLLSAYDLSGDVVFLRKAVLLGDKLIGAFNTRTGIPRAQLNMTSGKGIYGWSRGSAVLAELGTLQLEFRYLSYATKVQRYEEISMKAMQAMAAFKPKNGLYPILVSAIKKRFSSSHITFGASGDSFYEYLLKLWIQGGKQEAWLRDMYDRAIEGAIKLLLKASTPSGFVYLSDYNGTTNILKMDHLVCFMPGLLALGSVTDPTGPTSSRAIRDMKLAKDLMFTCREMYHRTATGIAPEYVVFREGQDMVPAPDAPYYLLRPEAAESLFVLGQLTQDPIYQEWSWEIWQAIDKHCKTEVGYAAIRNVQASKTGHYDRMESFFLAETMKYLYLAQGTDVQIDLRKYVFNTEAHPLRIFENELHVPVPESDTQH